MPLARQLAFALLAPIFLVACSIKQTVQPVSIPISEICIVENPEVLHEDFGVAYTSELRALGMRVRTVPAGTDLAQCEFMTTYTANWQWDLATYLCFAELRVFHQGRQVGSAVYDSRSGSGNMNKFIKADAKLKELVRALFPSSAPPQAPTPIQTN